MLIWLVDMMVWDEVDVACPERSSHMDYYIGASVSCIVEDSLWSYVKWLIQT